MPCPLLIRRHATSVYPLYVLKYYKEMAAFDSYGFKFFYAEVLSMFFVKYSGIIKIVVSHKLSMVIKPETFIHLGHTLQMERIFFMTASIRKIGLRLYFHF